MSGVQNEGYCTKTYGIGAGDTRCTKFVKLTGLFLGIQLYVEVVNKIPNLVCDLFNGEYRDAGEAIARENHRCKRWEWSILQENSTSPCPNDDDLKREITYQTRLQCAKTIVKLVTFPFKLIALQFALLFGMFYVWIDYETSQKPIAAIVSWWARDQIPFEGEDELFDSDRGNIDLFPNCVHPHEVWDKYNLYRYLKNYNPDLSTPRIVSNRLYQYQTLLEKEGLNVMDLINVVRGKYMLRKEFYTDILKTINEIRDSRMYASPTEEQKQLRLDALSRLKEVARLVEKP